MRFDPPPREMSRDAFVARFGGIYEHSPWIAEAVWDRGLTEAEDTSDGLAAAMANVLAAANDNAKLTLIHAHPDLAGRAAIAGDLTASSKSEQSGAGLDRCTPEEYARFQELNRDYKEKFGFPFILAVDGRGRTEILAAFDARIKNARDTEFRTALEQISRIARIRLEASAQQDDNDSLVHLLLLTAEFLEQYGETGWSSQIRSKAERRPLQPSDVLSWFGGMGSFNDLVLAAINGHQIDPPAEQAANARLGLLRESIYARAIGSTR